MDAGLLDAGASGNHIWSKRFGGGDYDYGISVAVDSAGNIYFTGTFKSTADFGGGALTSAGGYDAYLVSYTSSGTHRWSKRFGGPDNDIGTCVAIDSNDNVYLIGYFRGAADFGSGSVTSAGFDDIFVASFSSSGSYRWSKTFGSSGNDFGRHLAVDGNNDIYLVGSFQDTVSFGGPSLTSNGYTDAFLASYTSAGGHRWSQQMGGSNTAIGRSVAVGGGNLFVTGDFTGTASFGGLAVTSLGSGEAFLASYTLTGAHRWSKGLGGTDDDRGSAVAADAAGNIYMTGEFSGTASFGGAALVAKGTDDVFLSSYTSAGAHRWSKGFGVSGYNEGRAVAVDKSGTVYVTGEFQDSIDLGGSLLSSQGTYEIFVGSFTSAGTHRWSRRFGGSSIDYGRGVAVGGGVYVTGEFRFAADLGGTAPVSSAGTADIFVLKLQP